METGNADLDRIWDALVAGPEPLPTDPRLLGALRQRVVERLAAADVAGRTDALAVARALAPEGGLELVARFAADPDVGLRRRAFQAGIEAGTSGMPVVRAFLGDADTTLALDAFDAVGATADRSATPRLRALLDAPDPAVRAGACHLLGYLAGVVVRPALSALATADPDPRVREAATAASVRLTAPNRGSPTPVPRDVPSDAPKLAPPSTPSPARSPARPNDLEVSIAALARFGADDASLPELPDEAFARAASAYDVGGDPAHGRGAARWIRLRRSSSHLAAARRWLGDPDPTVRAAACDAVADVGGPSVLPALGARVSDSDPTVRRVALTALARCADRVGARDAIRRYLSDAARSGDSDLAAAARAIAQEKSG